MTEFKLSKNGQLVGFIDITNKGFSVTGQEELIDLLSDDGVDFRCTESDREDDETTYFFRATMPTGTMVQVLIRLKPILTEMGYEMIA